MRTIDIQELKQRIDSNMIIELMEYFNAEVQQETEEYIIYNSICHHNPDSKKLYFYKESNSFFCWSQCGNLDILSIVQEQEGLSFQEAIEWLENFFQLNKKQFGRTRIKHTPKEIVKKEINLDEKLPSYDSSILNTFINHQPIEWLNEGISKETMELFGIKFDINNNGIVIPHYDIHNRLIGIRLRNLDKETVERYAKYSPLNDRLSNIIYSHSLGKNLYGININKENIIKHKKVILVESEKSILKIQDFYPNDNISLAVCGSNITDYQLELLKSIGINQVIYCLDKETDEKWLKKADKIYKKTAMYFDTYIVEDTEGLLEEKDSPCDKGKEVFDKLLINKKEYKLEV